MFGILVGIDRAYRFRLLMVAFCSGFWAIFFSMTLFPTALTAFTHLIEKRVAVFLDMPFFLAKVAHLGTFCLIATPFSIGLR